MAVAVAVVATVVELQVRADLVSVEQVDLEVVVPQVLQLLMLIQVVAVAEVVQHMVQVEVVLPVL
jgi:hypothetical protein